MNKDVATFDDTAVIVSNEYYQYLNRRDWKLCAIEGAGVDNWSGYDHAMDDLREQGYWEDEDDD